MLRKIILSSLVVFSLNAYSTEVLERLTSYPDNVESENFENRIFHVNLGDIADKDMKKIKYVNQTWYLFDKIGERKYYIQKNEKTNVISRIRILYPFDDVITGKDLKNLENIYGQPLFFKDEARFTDGNISVDFYIGTDVLDRENKDEMTIVDILSHDLHKEKEETDHSIYNSQRMNRK